MDPLPYIKEQAPVKLPTHRKANFAAAKQSRGSYEDPLGDPNSDPREAAKQNTHRKALCVLQLDCFRKNWG